MPANLFLRSLYDDCNTLAGWQGAVRLSRQSFRDLEWWCGIPAQHLSASIRLRPAAVDMHVDASDSGWGAVLPDLADSPEGVASGQWSPVDRAMHINQKEMRAVRLALLSFAPVVRDRVVRIFEDNTVTASVCGRFASRSAVLMAEYRALWSVLEDLHVQLQVVRVASAANLADAPSRFVDRSDYFAPLPIRACKKQVYSENAACTILHASKLRTPAQTRLQEAGSCSCKCHRTCCFHTRP
eukprot:GHRQ01017782.1.p2 GENE.GHRQ01017782.1~~GHRQ01017782.1.p2  ORF type:complete len:241 (+),score=20.58 GHRQ01017782.1:1061-1783(+)